jgi:hypothetical protein
MNLKGLATLLLAPFMTGCMSLSKPVPTAPPPGVSTLDLLSLLGGICILGGVAAMVITRGSLGLRALGVGLGLVILNYTIARYADWIFIPVLVASAAISMAYAYRIVRQAILKKKETKK